MVRNGESLQSIVKADSSTKFERLVKQHGAEYGAKGYSCWNQLVSMLFCHLAKADSLREICNGLACCVGKLVHLDIDRRPNKSTLSYANAHRSAGLYEDLLWTSLEHFRSQPTSGRRHRFRFKDKLFSLDSTTISLCLSSFLGQSFGV